MAPRTTIPTATSKKDSADHGLVYSETTGFWHGLLGNFTAESLEESIEIIGDTVTNSKLGKLGKFTTNVAKFGIATGAGLLSGAGLQKTLDKVEIDWGKDTTTTIVTGVLGELAVLYVGMTGATAAIASAGIAATAATIYDKSKGMKERIEDALKLQEEAETAKEAAKLRGEELKLTDFEKRLQGVERYGRRVAAEMFPEQEAQTGGNGTAAGTEMFPEQEAQTGGNGTAAGTDHTTGSTSSGGHGHGNQNGGYGYGYNTAPESSPSSPSDPTPPQDIEEPCVVSEDNDYCFYIDENGNVTNPNPEDDGTQGATSKPSVGPAPGDVGGKYSQLMNPGSERGGRPSPDGDDSDGRGPTGPRPGNMSSVMNSEDYGCDPITGGGIGGGTQDEIGWNFFKTPPKKGGGRYGSSGTGFDDDYKPNPEDDYGVGGPTAKFFEGIQAGSSFEFVGIQSFETSNELQANNLMLTAMSVDTFGL